MAGNLLKFIGNYTTDAHGQILRLMDAIDVTAYTQVSVQFSTNLRSASNMIVNCNMGLYSETVVASTVGQFPLGGPAKIYSFPVVGPQFVIVLTGGPPNAQIPVEAWALLH